ncbi:hypothetical protein PPERSA_05810 [Pseudocohnilembus persalinus]|uniref:Transmembrane protein n=1 Tax=Pseudocohnilembus persalinus TaxID=266149 RepID=A0A0V0QGH5_PSEPJ|nr:hypothetical protein PPERSA_05810 [Pseudocohnilembus persalinus]|eukprot:KRX01224.1 hypothetical protein PPERSA_05810 [Pseudocohnilembus persalinus]
MQNKYQSNLQNEDSHDEETDYKQSNFEIQLDEKVEIQIDQDKFPFCIVWTPIPCLSWLFPIIGHTGICGSDGIQHDFVGPYYVAVGENPFGRPLKYIKLDKSQMKIQNYDFIIYVVITVIVMLLEHQTTWNIKGKLTGQCLEFSGFQ